MRLSITIWIIGAAYALYKSIRGGKMGAVLSRNEVSDEFANKQSPHIVKFAHKVLYKHNYYYRKLSKDGQLKFISRVLYVSQIKNFVGYHDLAITPEMRIVVLGGLVQLTFGYRKFSLPIIQRIILYPKQFYSRYFERDVKGLTSGAGFVTLSWKDTLHGFADETDNLNLVIHEMSHALVINWKSKYDNQSELAYLFGQYQADVMQEFKRLSAAGGNDYLREYAFTNEHEFFAVIVEHFFESPIEFQQRLGSLYLTLCRLLNQNPLNVNNDYKFK